METERLPKRLWSGERGCKKGEAEKRSDERRRWSEVKLAGLGKDQKEHHSVSGFSNWAQRSEVLEKCWSASDGGGGGIWQSDTALHLGVPS